MIFHLFSSPFSCLNGIHYITIRMWQGCEGCCCPTESTGFSLRPATSGPICIQSASTSGSLAQVNINPPPSLSISPITINHYSLQPSFTTASACQLLSVTGPFYCMISLPAEGARKGPIHLALSLHTQWLKKKLSHCVLYLSVVLLGALLIQKLRLDKTG